jgi:hypothetical protein
MGTRKLKPIGSDNPNWKGGKTTEHGYILIWKPDHPYCNKSGYVKEHRLVMEVYLGRYLDPKEKVHHKNGDKKDNRLDNLELFQSNSDHIKNGHGKKDKDYICKLCGADTTYKDKRGYQFWTRYEDGHICSRCSYKLFMPKRYKNKNSVTN